MIIPSIDLMNGKAVQLEQGKKKILERKDVIGLALEFRKYGEITVIDLDAAFGIGDNFELIKQICKIADCRVGGGIRTIEKANKILSCGAKKILIGTKASKNFLKKLPKERIIVAIDTKGGVVVNKGWKNKTKKTPQELIKELKDYCSGFLFTNVDAEGLMKGIDFSIINELKILAGNNLTIAGGICSIDEIKKLESSGIDSQLGMSIYTGKIMLDEAFISVLDFKKCNGLIPTIVEDEQNRVLMSAYSSKESLKKTFMEGKAVYYSRSRKKLWTKGETSGNFQELIKARFDCDRDSILFTISQKSFACHNGDYSCFGEKQFNFDDLYEVIKDRISSKKEDSYTSNIALNELKLKEKILEECMELIDYKDRDNLVWEAADLIYFVLILMAKNNVTIKDVENELWRRRK